MPKIFVEKNFMGGMNFVKVSSLRSFPLLYIIIIIMTCYF